MGRPRKAESPDMQEFLKLSRTYIRQLELLEVCDTISEGDKKLYTASIIEVNTRIKDVIDNKLRKLK